MTHKTRSSILRFWRDVAIALTMLGIIGMCVANASHAHDDAILRCDRNIKIDRAVKVDEQTLTNGLLAEHYDRNGDGLVDIHVYSAITGFMDDNGYVPHKAFPIFWHVDLDFNGKVDKVYVDIHGEGRCDDIVLYLDLNAPLSEEMFRGVEPTDPKIVEEDTIITPGGEI